MKLLLVFLLLALPFFGASTLIDSGGPTDICTGGAAFTVSSTTVPDRTIRYGTVITCRIPASGDSTAILRFLEPSFTTVGSRLFSVSINDQVVIDRLDLIAVAGAILIPYSRKFQATPRNGFIDIVFTGQVWNAVVSSIEIVSLPIPPAAPVDVGIGLISTFIPGGKQTLMVDTAKMLHLGQDAGLPLPAAGDGCDVSGAVIVGPDAVYFCAAILPLSTNPKPWGRWLKIAATPTVASAARSVLDARCIRCHGADLIAGDVHLVGGLDLRSYPAMLQGGSRGPAIVPGNAAESLLYKFIARPQYPTATKEETLALTTSNENTLGMPPFFPLSKGEIETIRMWIDQGAEAFK